MAAQCSRALEALSALRVTADLAAAVQQQYEAALQGLETTLMAACADFRPALYSKVLPPRDPPSPRGPASCGPRFFHVERMRGGKKSGGKGQGSVRDCALGAWCLRGSVCWCGVVWCGRVSV